MNVFIDGMIFGHQKVGGVSTMWREYLKRFPGQVSQLKLFSPYAPENTAFQEAIRNRKEYQLVVDPFPWPLRLFWNPAVRSSLLKFYVDKEVDIFHSTYYSTISNPEIRKVVTIYDMIFERFPQSMPRRWYRFNLAMKSRSIRNADAIVTISKHTKADLMYFYPDLPEEKIHVIYLGAPAPEDGFHVAQLLKLIEQQKIDISPHSYYCFVGQRAGYKNFEILIELVKRGNTARRKVLCVGDANDHYPDLVQNAGLSEHFVFLRQINEQDLKILYHFAYALIYPSHYEGFGLPVLEAMAYQCPVISSNQTSLPEVGGDASIYFDPKSVDALENAIRHLEETGREPWIERGKKNLKRFSWDTAVASLVKIYQDILE